MKGSKEYFCIMQEQTFNDVPSELRMQFRNVEVKEVNEWETHKNDPVYLQLYKAKKKANENLRNYLYEKRHK